MRNRKRYLLMGMAGLCLVVILLFVAAATLLPPLLNSDRVKSMIVTKASEAAGTRLDYERIGISFLPTPRLVAKGLGIEKPGVISLKADKLAIFPRIIPLLGRRLSIRRLVVEAPDIRWQFTRGEKKAPPARETKTENAESQAPWAIIEQHLATVFAQVAAIDQSTVVEIDHGRATLAIPGKTDMAIADIDLVLTPSGKGLTLDLSFSSRLVRAAKLNAQVNALAQTATASLSLSGLDVNRILSHASLPPGIARAGQPIDADFDLAVQAADKADCRFTVNAPSLEIKRGERVLTLSETALAGKLAYTSGQVSLKLDRIAARSPAIALSAGAALGRDAKTKAFSLILDAAAQKLDIAVVAEACRAIAGDSEAIATAFDYARAGILTDATYSATFKRDQKSWQLQGDTASGRISDGEVHIEAIRADVTHATGKIAYRGGHVKIKSLSGRFQGVAVKDLDFALDWTEQLLLSIESPSATVLAVPFSSWLFSLEGLADAGQAVTVAGGELVASRLKINGPLDDPRKWDIDIAATPRDLVLKPSQTPFDIKLNGGTLFYRTAEQRSENVGIEFLDADLTASHRSTGLPDLQNLTLRGEGSLGPQAIAWIYRQAKIPDHLKLKAPLFLKAFDLAWTQPASLSLSGELRIADETTVAVNLTHPSGDTGNVKLQIIDTSPRATLMADKQKGGLIDVSLSGNVDKQTMDRLLETNRILSGTLKSDLKARIDTTDPLAGTVTGKIDADGLFWPSSTGVPITLDHVSILGQGNRLKIRPSTVTLEETPFSIDGNLFWAKEILAFDIAVATDRLDTELIERLAPQKKKAPPSTNSQPSPPPKVVPHGRIHLDIGSAAHETYTLTGIDADIWVEADDTQITINQANLCGIDTTGEVLITPKGVDVTIDPRAKGASLQKAITCFQNKDVRAQGHYDLGGKLSFSPSAGDPLSSLSGQVSFSSQNGQIYYSNTLLKILSVLNVTELLAGGKSDLTQKGSGYSTVWAKTTIKNGLLSVDEFLFDGNALKMTGQGKVDLKENTADITLLVAPLKTIDRLVSKLPLIGYITKGTLVTVPIRLSGNVDDLSVVPLPPSEVGKGLLGFMERVVKLPFVLVENPSKAISGDTR